MQHALYKAHTKQSLIYTPAPPPASHAITTQTLKLVTPPLTQHGKEVKSPPTAHITVSSDLLLKLREEIEVLKSEVKDLKEEVARLKAAPPPRSQYKIWHQESNRIAGTFDSQSPPTHSYDYAYMSRLVQQKGNIAGIYIVPEKRAQAEYFR